MQTWLQSSRRQCLIVAKDAVKTITVSVPFFTAFLLFLDLVSTRTPQGTSRLEQSRLASLAKGV
jgi:hypothetical protein